MRLSLDYNYDWTTHILKMWVCTRYNNYNKAEDKDEAISRMHFSFSIDVLGKDNNEMYNMYTVIQAAVNGFNQVADYNYKIDSLEENLKIVDAFESVLKTLNIYCKYAYVLKERPYASFAGMLIHYSKLVQKILIAPELVYQTKFDIRLINANLPDYPYHVHEFVLNSDQLAEANKIVREINDIDYKMKTQGLFINHYEIEMYHKYGELFNYLKFIDAIPLTTENIPANPYDDYHAFLKTKDKEGEANACETNTTKGIIH